MNLWKLTLSYDGTAFHGWQVQPGLPTVQGRLAEAIEYVTGEQLVPQGSGRTDAGVHALGQVASFALEARIPALNLQHALNRALPQSIRVLSAEVMNPTFHARHSAIRKTYEYRIFKPLSYGKDRSSSAETICSPFDAPFVWDCHWELQLEPMQRAAQLLCGTHDFTSFAASDPDLAQRKTSSPNLNPVRTIYLSNVERQDTLVFYRVTGNGFLHHMVRNIVGTLVDVGRGSYVAEDMPRILAAKNRSAAGPTAPAQGLFLSHVEYANSAYEEISASQIEALEARG